MRQNLISAQRGLNLIELMIAIVIGLFISLMVVQYLSSSSKLFKQQGVDTTLEANGTFAISYLSRFIRQAGGSDPQGTDIPFLPGDCGGTDPNNSENPCTYNSDALEESDQMAVITVPRNLKDCVGNDVDDEDDRIANVFRVEDSQLFCRGYDIDAGAWLGPEESLIDGIEQMQVLYGVSNDADVIYSYVDASRVAAPGEDEEEAWDRVRSVKIALLVSDGTAAGTETTEARTYQLLDSPQVEFTDRVLRKVYTTTIQINNKLP